jgi:2-iminobutanoate/2-iminopropanoate deaminase
MMLKTISTENAPAAIGPYSQAVAAGKLLFASGQIPIVPETGALAQGGVTAQAGQALKNVGEILKSAGACYGDVVKTTCFLADMGDFAAFNEVYAKYFPGKPARSCAAVKDLPKGALCEVEAVAVLK